MNREPTPVTIWAPAFHWLHTISPENSQGGPFADDTYWCRFCQSYLLAGERVGHAKQHQRELDAYRKSERRERDRVNRERLRLVNRLKKETR